MCVNAENDDTGHSSPPWERCSLPPTIVYVGVDKYAHTYKRGPTPLISFVSLATFSPAMHDGIGIGTSACNVNVENCKLESKRVFESSFERMSSSSNIITINKQYTCLLTSGNVHKMHGRGKVSIFTSVLQIGLPFLQIFASKSAFRSSFWRRRFEIPRLGTGIRIVGLGSVLGPRFGFGSFGCRGLLETLIARDEMSHSE